jgi:hypothetical protein
LRIITEQDDCNAGQASRRSSRFQPGNCEKLAARIAGPGRATGLDGVDVGPVPVLVDVEGGSVVWQAASKTATDTVDMVTLRRLIKLLFGNRFNDIGDKFKCCG